jgi:hypothetical protein
MLVGLFGAVIPGLRRITEWFAADPGSKTTAFLDPGPAVHHSLTLTLHRIRDAASRNSEAEIGTETHGDART